MLRTIFALFGPEQKEREMVTDLDRMIRNSVDLVRMAGDACFERSAEQASVDAIKRADKDVNRLQRAVRKEAFAEVLADSKRFSLPFCLSVLNVAKDVERIGDYAKELAALVDLVGPVRKSGDLSESFAELAGEVDEWMAFIPPALHDGDQVTAFGLIEKGKGIRRELVRIQRTLLTEQHSTPRAASDALAVQYYIRIVSHGLNALSTVVTPLDRMDHTSKKDLLPEVREKLKAREEAQT